jgi:hypothetical protein
VQLGTPLVMMASAPSAANKVLRLLMRHSTVRFWAKAACCSAVLC